MLKASVRLLKCKWTTLTRRYIFFEKRKKFCKNSLIFLSIKVKNVEHDKNDFQSESEVRKRSRKKYVCLKKKKKSDFASQALGQDRPAILGGSGKGE